MSRKIFITGTDTGIGKTYIATKMLSEFTAAGKKTLGLKPIASGCEYVNGRLVNQDALQLRAASSIKVDYDTTNPFAYEPAIAPHIAANLRNETLSLDKL